MNGNEMRAEITRLRSETARLRFYKDFFYFVVGFDGLPYSEKQGLILLLAAWTDSPESDVKENEEMEFGEKVFKVLGIIIKAPKGKPLTFDEVIAASPFSEKETRKIVVSLHSDGLIDEVPA